VVEKLRGFEEAMNFINQYQWQSLHSRDIAMAPSPASDQRSSSESKYFERGHGLRKAIRVDPFSAKGRR
jgi:hypothetical protein